MKEMLGGCCVCSDERGWTENPLVYCDGQGCTVAVHQGLLSFSSKNVSLQFSFPSFLNANSYLNILLYNFGQVLILFSIFSACYGIVNVPSGPWFCRKCESQERAARVVSSYFNFVQVTFNLLINIFFYLYWLYRGVNCVPVRMEL